MTDFRALCAELMDAIDSGIPVERMKQSPLAVRVDAALSQPEPQGPVPVAERLPGPEDCDAEGRCFVWDWRATEWRFLERSIFDHGWQDAYWLPHNALPVPQQGE
jgi:hypothetical protein